MTQIGMFAQLSNLAQECGEELLKLRQHIQFLTRSSRLISKDQQCSKCLEHTQLVKCNDCNGQGKIFAGYPAKEQVCETCNGSGKRCVCRPILDRNKLNQLTADCAKLFQEQGFDFQEVNKNMLKLILSRYYFEEWRGYNVTKANFGRTDWSLY